MVQLLTVRNALSTWVELNSLFQYHQQRIPVPQLNCTNGSTVQMVQVAETAIIQDRTVQLIQVSVPVDINTKEVLIEQWTINLSKHLLIPRTVTQVTTEGCALIQVMNTSSQQTTLYKGTRIGEYTPIHSLLLVETESDTTLTQSKHGTLAPNIDLSCSGLAPDQV